jgi:hypothetical protein
VHEIVAIWYRGASYQIGRGLDFYGIWPAGESGTQPFERWSLTPEGWHGAWSRFTGIEAPATIVQVDQRTIVPVGQGAAVQVGQGAAVQVGQGAAVQVGQGAAVQVGQGAAVQVGQGAAVQVGQGTIVQVDQRSAVPVDQRSVASVGQGITAVARTNRRSIIAAALLAVGVACGIAGLFPDYFAGASLAQQPAELVPHAIYFAAWTVSAVLILLGGARLRVGALLGIGTSIVTFGLFFADAGTVIAGGAHLMGAGLVLGLVGWLACAAGSTTAFRRRSVGALGRPDSRTMFSFVALTLAALGAAIAFAPAWDSYTLHASSGATQTVTEGNAFSYPGPVIAGNVAVMVALVAVVVAAALWRPILQGAALLAGALVPMAAQAISALVGLTEAASPSQFGISSAQAAQAGITISSGVTPAFWFYWVFVIVLVAMCVRMFISPPAVALGATPPRPVALDATQPGPVAPLGATQPGSVVLDATQPGSVALDAPGPAQSR